MFATLADMKAAYFRAIDARTQEVLARGFTYSGVTVGLSLQAQVRYEALKDSGLLATTSVEANDDNNPPLSLSTSLAIGAFVDAARAYVRTVYSDANALKASVRSATTVAGVEAVVDNR